MTDIKVGKKIIIFGHEGYPDGEWRIEYTMINDKCVSTCPPRVNPALFGLSEEETQVLANDNMNNVVAVKIADLLIIEGKEFTLSPYDPSDFLYQ
jgi:hypothetical protein